MPERVGLAAAGRRVICSRHDKPRSPAWHNSALCLIAGPENLEGEVSRHGLRLRHRERQINITSGCASAGSSKANHRRGRMSTVGFAGHECHPPNAANFICAVLLDSFPASREARADLF